jgi:hypothetical protein
VVGYKCTEASRVFVFTLIGVVDDDDGSMRRQPTSQLYRMLMFNVGTTACTSLAAY